MIKQVKHNTSGGESGSIPVRLKGVAHSLETIQSVIIVAGDVLSHQSADFDPDVARILIRCASYPLDDELKELNSIIDSLGGNPNGSNDEGNRPDEN